MTKLVNEVNELLKGIPVKNLSEIKSVGGASALLVCEKIHIKVGTTLKERKLIWNWHVEKTITILRKDLSQIYFQGRRTEKEIQVKS